MSLLSRAANAAQTSRTFMNGTGDPWAIPTNGSLAGATATGVAVNEDSAMRLLVVASAVRILSDAVSGLPFEAVRANGDIRSTISPAPTIVADPFGNLANGSRLTRRQGFGQIMVSLLLRGNAYCIVLARDQAFRPTCLMVLHPDAVKCAYDEDGLRQYEVNRQPVPAGDVVHLTGMSFPGSPVGISVIQYAREAIGLGLAAEEFGARFFGSGAHMSGIVTVPGDLDKERARALKESFQGSHGGLKNSHTVGVLTGGAEWKPISVTPEDAQFLGTRAAQNLDLAMLFGVPPHMLGQVDKTTSWGTGIEQQGLGFLVYTLSPWIGRFEDAWSAMLARPQTARFDTDAILRTDAAGRMAFYSAARAAAILTTNEIRARENYAPIEGGDDIAAPLNSSVSPGKDTEASSTAPKADALGAVL